MPEVIEATASTSVAAAGVAAEVTEAPKEDTTNDEPILTPVEQLFQAIKMGADADAIVAKLTVPNPRELVQSRDAQGHTTAHWAAKRGEPWLLRLLLDKGASVSAASEDDVGMRPLHWACTEGAISASRGTAAASRHRCDSSPSDEIAGGFFFDFEAIRTESSDRDAPRR
jgi:hypothetical protein